MEHGRGAERHDGRRIDPQRQRRGPVKPPAVERGHDDDRTGQGHEGGHQVLVPGFRVRGRLHALGDHAHAIAEAEGQDDEHQPTGSAEHHRLEVAQMAGQREQGGREDGDGRRALEQQRHALAVRAGARLHFGPSRGAALVLPYPNLASTFRIPRPMAENCQAWAGSPQRGSVRLNA